MDRIQLELPNDTFRNGFQQVKSKTEIVHPLQESLALEEEKSLKQKYFALSHVYGSAMPMKLELEKRLVSMPLRLPNLVSSNLGMETLTSDIDFDYEDFLNVPENSEFSVDLHMAMEKNLKIETKMRF